MLAVPLEPGIELPARDPEEAAGLTDIVGDLPVVLNPPQSGLRLSQLLLLGGRFSHEHAPSIEIWEMCRGKVNSYSEGGMGCARMIAHTPFDVYTSRREQTVEDRSRYPARTEGLLI